LYPKKENGDKVQYWVSRTPEDSPLEQHLAAPRTATPYEETKSFMRDKWDAESLALNSEPRFSGRTNGGGGGSSSERTGTKVGSMSYSINGVEGEILYRYNDGQDKEQVEKKIRESLDWQSKDVGTRNELIEYFNNGYPINIDVSLSGKEIATYYNEDCCRNYKYLNGSSSSDWKYQNQEASYDDCYTLNDKWIYIASEFINEGVNGDAGKYHSWKNNFDGSLTNELHVPVDFNLTFSHEMGHRFDSFNYYYDLIDVELYAYNRTIRQYTANNPGRIIKIP